MTRLTQIENEVRPKMRLGAESKTTQTVYYYIIKIRITTNMFNLAGARAHFFYCLF